MPRRSLTRIVEHMEFGYEMWEAFVISTDAMVSLLRSLLNECGCVGGEASMEDNTDMLRRVCDVMCKLNDTWSAHVDEEHLINLVTSCVVHLLEEV